MAKQFTLLKEGDRFFYSHGGDVVADPLNDAQVDALMSRRMSDMICDNTYAKMTREDALLAQSPEMCCITEHRKLDLTLFAGPTPTPPAPKGEGKGKGKGKGNGSSEESDEESTP